MPLNFDQPALALARDLIGATLLVRGAGGTVIETEAYAKDDPASHSFRGPTPRNAAMFGPPGFAYIYLSYGMHLCLNVVAQPGEAVLIRALLPTHGLMEMAARRGLPIGSRLIAAGPGRLAQALGITLHDNGKPFDGDLSLHPPEGRPAVLTGPRIGITRAADLPWRFGLAGARGLSRPFPPQD